MRFIKENYIQIEHDGVIIARKNCPLSELQAQTLGVNVKSFQTLTPCCWCSSSKYNLVKCKHFISFMTAEGGDILKCKIGGQLT